MRHDNKGYIVLETTVSFLLFVFLMVSILSLINIVTVQARVHYAMTETAKTVSMYCYALDKVGFADPIMKGQERADKAQDEIRDFKNNLSGILDAVNDFSQAHDFEDVYATGEKIYESGKGILEQGKNLAETDPKDLFQTFLNYGIDKIGSQGYQWLLQRLMIRYLSNGQMDGDTFLRTFGVIDGVDGLQFAVLDTFDINATQNIDSKLLTAKGDVRIIVKYKVNYTFGALPLPFKELNMTQEVVTKAWLKGDGEGYGA